MAKYYFIPRRLAKQQPKFNKIAWRLEAWAIGAFLGLLRALPLERATWLSHRLFSIIGPRSAQRVRVMRNLHVAFPDQPETERVRLMRAIFDHVGVALAEIVQLGRIWKDRERRLEFVAAPELEFVRQKGRPAVLVTAHIGPWTLTNFVASAFGFPLAVVYAPESNPYVRNMMLRFRSALPVELVSRKNSMRTLMSELERGGKVGLGSDVRLDAGQMIPFFGHDMATNTVPARLALRYGCELVPTRAERLPGGRFRITMYPPVRPDDPRASMADQAASMSRKLNKQFEAWIRANPGEWVCLARRWPKDVERAICDQVG